MSKLDGTPEITRNSEELSESTIKELVVCIDGLVPLLPARQYTTGRNPEEGIAWTAAHLGESVVLAKRTDFSFSGASYIEREYARGVLIGGNIHETSASVLYRHEDERFLPLARAALLPADGLSTSTTVLDTLVAYPQLTGVVDEYLVKTTRHILGREFEVFKKKIEATIIGAEGNETVGFAPHGLSETRAHDALAILNLVDPLDLDRYVPAPEVTEISELEIEDLSREARAVAYTLDQPYTDGLAQQFSAYDPETEHTVKIDHTKAEDGRIHLEITISDKQNQLKKERFTIKPGSKHGHVATYSFSSMSRPIPTATVLEKWVALKTNTTQPIKQNDMSRAHYTRLKQVLGRLEHLD